MEEQGDGSVRMVRELAEPLGIHDYEPARIDVQRPRGELEDRQGPEFAEPEKQVGRKAQRVALAAIERLPVGIDGMDGNRFGGEKVSSFGTVAWRHRAE